MTDPTLRRASLQEQCGISSNGLLSLKSFVPYDTLSSTSTQIGSRAGSMRNINKDF